MIKNSQKQSRIIFFVVILIALLTTLGVLGYVYWNGLQEKDDLSQLDSQNETDTSTKTENTGAYGLFDAVKGINLTLSESKQVCDLDNPLIALNESDFSIVANTDAFNYQRGESFINEQFNYAYAQYMCGPEGAKAILKRTDDGWKLLNNDERMYPYCEAVRGEDVPPSIVDRCYEDRRATETVAI